MGYDLLTGISKELKVYCPICKTWVLVTPGMYIAAHTISLDGWPKDTVALHVACPMSGTKLARGS